jgi:hypothetical protein
MAALLLGMAVEDAVLAALLLVLSATLLWLALAAVRRYQNRSFRFLALAFGLVLAEGVALSLSALGFAFPGGIPVAALAGVQVAVLLLVYAATFPLR